MKTEIHNKKKHLLISLGIICLFGVIYAQDSKPNVKSQTNIKPKITTKPPVINKTKPFIISQPSHVPTEPKEPVIFDRSEVMPQYPGGVFELMKFIEMNIEYPINARQNKLEGRVVLKFIIDTDGTVIEPIILKDMVGGGCGDEAIRVVKSMPKWKPGTQNGKPVKVYYVLPITFKLD